MLHVLERLSFWYADRIITPNIAFRDLFASRSCRAEKVKIVLNSPEGDVFDPELFPSTQPDPAEFRVMHHGLIAHRHGVDQLVEAIALLRPKIPGLRLDLYGEATPFYHEVEALARKLGVFDIFHHHGELSKEAIAAEIPKCHVGIVSNRRSVFTEINFPTRIFEYLAMDRPVVAPSTQGIRDYFKPDEIVLFTPGSAEDMAAKILWVRDHPAEAAAALARGQDVYRQYLWQDERIGFLDLVASVAKAGRRS
jgi:glycosyltransferase involved in cell wall biosynthesis